MVPFDSAGRRSGWPALDDRLVIPETDYEMYDGELVHVSPADPPHATRHLQLCALIEAHTGRAFEAGCELLTRPSDDSDFAPDVSVYPDGPDPDTGGRQLEQLVFEVVSTQSLSNAAYKARQLSARGVRRVFAIDLPRSRALEWSAAEGTWSELDADGYITDPALEVALPVRALIHSAKADDDMARALLAKHNPVLEAVRAGDRAEGRAEGLVEGRAEGLVEGRAEGLAEGRAEGTAEGMSRGKAIALIAMLEARGVPITTAQRDRILGERDAAMVERWITAAVVCATVAELLAR